MWFQNLKIKIKLKTLSYWFVTRPLVQVVYHLMLNESIQAVERVFKAILRGWLRGRHLGGQLGYILSHLVHRIWNVLAHHVCIVSLSLCWRQFQCWRGNGGKLWAAFHWGKTWPKTRRSSLLSPGRVDRVESLLRFGLYVHLADDVGRGRRQLGHWLLLWQLGFNLGFDQLILGGSGKRCLCQLGHLFSRQFLLLFNFRQFFRFGS